MLISTMLLKLLFHSSVRRSDWCKSLPFITFVFASSFLLIWILIQTCLMWGSICIQCSSNSNANIEAIPNLSECKRQVYGVATVNVQYMAQTAKFDKFDETRKDSNPFTAKSKST